jgi:hypothetical protein
MTTITERMEYASAAAHDFADAAMVQLFTLLGIHERIGDETAAKHHPVLLAALIDAAAKTYAIERQCESAERIADAVNDVGMAIRESSLPQATMELADALFRLKSVGRDALDMVERTRKGATK